MKWEEIRAQALARTKQSLKAAVGPDQFITQSARSIEELDKVANMLSKRVREWYEWYAPEVSRKLGDNEAFVRLISSRSRADLMKELSITTTMGAQLREEDVDVILSLAKMVHGLYIERTHIEAYLEQVMSTHCPSLLVLAGSTIGAKLLNEAGSLKRLAFIPAGTIQLYGAEKALFRHLKTGAKPPKHGHIINHPLVVQSQDKGKAARSLADKLSIACKVDYFKGEPAGHMLKEELHKRFVPAKKGEDS